MSSSSNIALFSNDPLITSSSSIFNSDHLLHLSPSPLFKWCLHNPESKEKEVQEKNHYHHSIGDHHMLLLLLLPMHPNAHMVQPVYIWLSYKKQKCTGEIRLIACSKLKIEEKTIIIIITLKCARQGRQDRQRKGKKVSLKEEEEEGEYTTVPPHTVQRKKLKGKRQHQQQQLNRQAQRMEKRKGKRQAT